MKSEYNALIQLKNMPGWDILQVLWVKQHSKIVEAMRRAGKKGNDSSWRYYAGQQEGFDVAVTQLERALIEMQEKDADIEPHREVQEQIDELLRKTKGESS